MEPLTVFGLIVLAWGIYTFAAWFTDQMHAHEDERETARHLPERATRPAKAPTHTGPVFRPVDESTPGTGSQAAYARMRETMRHEPRD